LFFTNAVGIPCHMDALRVRTLVSAPLVSEALWTQLEQRFDTGQKIPN
jgi:hypothetical protein